MGSMTRACLIFLFFLLVATPFQNLAVAGNLEDFSVGGLKAGAAKVVMTPENSPPLAGYGARRGRPAKGTHDPIHVRALVLDDSERRVAICSMDLLITTIELRKAILDRAKTIGFDALLLFATHNHSGLGGYVDNLMAETLALGPYDEGIFRLVVEKTSEAIVQASRSLQPAAIGQAKALTPHLSINRRERGGAVDPEIGVIHLVGARGDPIALLVNFAAHPTILGPENMLISGDYPGYLARYLERRADIVLFASGASADVGPVIREDAAGFEQAKAIGELLGEEVLRVLGTTKAKNKVRIAVVEREIQLPSRPSLVPVLRFPLLTSGLNLLADIWLPERTFLQVISIDHLLLLGVPCDLGVEVGLEIKARVRPRAGYIISQANDYIGYVITRDQYREGGYEAKMSFYGPSLVDLIKGELLEMTGALDQKQ